MSAQQQAGPGSTPAAVQQLVLQAELHASTVTEALTHYEAALEQLNIQIRSATSDIVNMQGRAVCMQDNSDMQGPLPLVFCVA